MHFSTSLLTAITAFVATANAVGICTGVNSDGTCTLGTCVIRDISVGQTLNVPGTQCIFNTDIDSGFDLKICNQANLGGVCNDLEQQPRKVVNGDFNWPTPGTQSIQRTGN